MIAIAGLNKAASESTMDHPSKENKPENRSQQNCRIAMNKRLEGVVPAQE
jgi:hypothetical protein